MAVLCPGPCGLSIVWRGRSRSWIFSWFRVEALLSESVLVFCCKAHFIWFYSVQHLARQVFSKWVHSLWSLWKPCKVVDFLLYQWKSSLWYLCLGEIHSETQGECVLTGGGFSQPNPELEFSQWGTRGKCHGNFRSLPCLPQVPLETETIRASLSCTGISSCCPFLRSSVWVWRCDEFLQALGSIRSRGLVVPP